MTVHSLTRNVSAAVITSSGCDPEPSYLQPSSPRQAATPSHRICSRHRLVRLRPRAIVSAAVIASSGCDPEPSYLQPSSPRQAATPSHRISVFFCASAACFDDILRNSSTDSLCTQRRHTSVVASAQTRSATGRWRMPCSNLGRRTADVSAIIYIIIIIIIIIIRLYFRPQPI